MAISTTDSTPPAGLRKALGFTQTRSLTYFLILGGLFSLFAGEELARLVAHGGVYASYATPRGSLGATFHFLTKRRFAWGMTVHLACILPAALLAVTQFIPIIRRRWPIVHRTAGYACLALCVPGIAATQTFFDLTYGGDLSVRSSLAALAVSSSYALVRAWRAIARERNVPEHRAWMLRAWAYLGAIETMRPITFGMGALVGVRALSDPVYAPIPCDQLRFIVEHPRMNASVGGFERLYPGCVPGSGDSTGFALVEADFAKGIGAARKDMGQAGMNVSFGSAMWVALVLHAALVEWYIRAGERRSKAKGA